MLTLPGGSTLIIKEGVEARIINPTWHGIGCNGDLTIDGGGTLSVSCGAKEDSYISSISCSGDVVIRNMELNMPGIVSDGYVRGIFADNITVENCIFSAENLWIGLQAYASEPTEINIKDSTVSIQEGIYGMVGLDGSISIDNSRLAIACDASLYTEYSKYPGQQAITITGSEGYIGINDPAREAIAVAVEIKTADSPRDGCIVIDNLRKKYQIDLYTEIGSSSNYYYAVIGEGDQVPAYYVVLGREEQPALTITGMPQSILQGDSFTLTASGGAGTGAVSWNVTSGNAVVDSNGKVTVTGTGEITVTAVKAEDEDYYESLPASVTFTALTNDLAGAEAVLSGASGLTSDGTAKTPDVTVKLNGQTLVKDTDYTVEYKNNVNAGTATVVITGIGRYAGTQSLSFTIGQPSAGTQPPATTQPPAGTDPSTDAEPSADAQPLVSGNLNTGLRLSWSGSSLKIRWGQLKNISGYELYVAKCGSKFPKKATVTVKKSTITSRKISKLLGKKLNTKNSYKVIVKAYRTVDGNKTYVQTSRILHVTGKKNKKYTNAKKVTSKKKSYTLAAGKTAKLTVKVTKQSSKKLLDHGAKLRYWSTNTAVATVTKAGKVKTVGTGTCYIYAMAANGVKTKVKITVK